MLEKWINKPAKWWQFWLPQSGIVGGSILGLLAGFSLTTLYKWCTM